MSVLSNDQLMMTGDGYNIDRSLRFRSSASAYLNRTPASAGNRKTWTWSGWVKLGAAQTNTLFGYATDSNNYELFQVLSDGTIRYIVVIGGTNSGQRNTTRLLRDNSAWYHLVLSKNAASTAVNIYVNGGSAESSFSTSVAVSNVDGFVNNTVLHRIGLVSGTSLTTSYLDGYLAEVNFIDGQALTPSSFGQTDAVTGVWVPKKYTGTYGTNGFYLPFSDNTSATTLAYDKSGNGNNWTANNISTTAGSTYDSMLDVPTLTSATAANYCTWNPLNKHSSLDIREANLNVYTGTTSEGVLGTLGVSSGKWYFEWYTTATTGGWPKIGIAPVTADATQTNGVFNTGYAYAANGTKRSPGSDVAYGASFAANDIIGVALDMDAGTLTFYKNNVSQGTAFTGLSGTFTPVVMTYGSNYLNCGQRPFSYTPPTGFKALNTFNLPDPTIKKPNQYMDATTYTSTGTTQTITNAGGFQPDFVWQKARGNVQSHYLTDSVRGVTKYLSSNSTAAEATDATWITSLNSNGVTFGTGNLANGWTNVIWQWKKGATPGFDIVTYTFGSTGIATINHNLGVVPKMIIAKRRDTTEQWLVYHASGTTQSQYLELNTTAAVATSANLWGSSPITSSQFYFNATSGYQYVFYLFAEIPGFSKFGSYTGNGSTDGSFVYCGFRPKYVMVKVSSGTADDWYILDSTRNTYNATNPNYALYADLSNAEANYSAGFLDFTSNGFKLRSTGAGSNANGSTYIYAAFAENPFKYSNAR